MIYRTTEYPSSSKMAARDTDCPDILVAESFDPNRFVFVFLSILLSILAVCGITTFAVGLINGDLALIQYRKLLIVLLIAGVGSAIFARLLYNRTRNSCVLFEKSGKLFFATARQYFRGNMGFEQNHITIFVTGVVYEIFPKIGKTRKSKDHLLAHEYGLWLCVSDEKLKRRVILYSSYETPGQATEGMKSMQHRLMELKVKIVESYEIKHKIRIAYRAY